MAEPKNKKQKRVIPLRTSGETVNSQSTRPSQLLFGEVKRLQEEMDSELPSTLEKELPSTFDITSRPQTESNAVHQVPSTKTKASRPQKTDLPSTKRIVDVLPSTDLEMPSTETAEFSDVDVLTAATDKKAVHNRKILPSTKNGSKGDRHNKFLARYDNRIKPEIKKKIDVFCATFQISQRDFAEQSAVHFIEVWTARLNKNVDGKTAHDDRGLMRMWKTAPSIINLYLAYNPNNKWRFPDDEAGVKYNETDLRLIELGIIETQFNSGFKKINSFSYYLNEIENFAGQNLSEDMLTFLTGHYREKWKGKTGREINV